MSETSKKSIAKFQ